MHDLLHDVTHEFLHVDSKIFRTVKLLLLKPGFLTASISKAAACAMCLPSGFIWCSA
jgi:Protein of unknown function (DUF3667)